MSWFRVDDQSTFHAKIVKAKNEAWGACCRAGAWSAARLTNGRIPIEVAFTIAPKKIWDRLIEVGLVEKLADELQIHDYLQWNPSREEVLAERARKAANMAGHRKGTSQPRARRVTGHVTGNDTGNHAGNEPAGNHGPVPIPIPEEGDPPKSPQFENIRETACRAYGEGIQAITGGTGFSMLESETTALMAAVDANPRWVGLRGEMLARVIRKSAADYARDRQADAKFERGFAPTKWLEWLRSGGSTSGNAAATAVESAGVRSSKIQDEILKKYEDR